MIDPLPYKQEVDGSTPSPPTRPPLKTRQLSPPPDQLKAFDPLLEGKNPHDFDSSVPAGDENEVAANSTALADRPLQWWLDNGYCELLPGCVQPITQGMTFFEAYQRGFTELTRAGKHMLEARIRHLGALIGWALALAGAGKIQEVGRG